MADSPHVRQSSRRIVLGGLAVLASVTLIGIVGGQALASAGRAGSQPGSRARSTPVAARVPGAAVATSAPRATTAGHPSAAPKPATRSAPKPLFGLASAAGSDQGVAQSLATAARLGRHADVVSFYMAWGWKLPVPVANLEAISTAGSEPEITWEPWDPRLGVNQPAYSLSRIAAGAYDSYIREWGRQLAAYDKPVMLRFAHEMNGSWYPWSAGVNGNTAADYVAAYRHVHDLVVAAGARNVTWVWSPNVTQGLTTPLAAVYPGSRYVDVVGLDGYNGGAPSYGPWNTPKTLFSSTLAQVAALAPTARVIINETGTGEAGGNKAAWISALFSYLEQSTRVSGVIWFNIDNAGVADWRLDSSAASASAARTALHSW